MSDYYENDEDTIRELLVDPGVWAVVGLSTNSARVAFGVSRFVSVELGHPLIAIHPKAESVHGFPGYASLNDVPDTDIKVVDCFVNSTRVGAVVDDAIANKDRLKIDAIWMQLGVIDEAAADRAKAAGLKVVMDTCPKIEWPKLAHDGSTR